MKLWRNNRLDAAYSLPNDDVARQFIASHYNDTDMRSDRALALFIASPDGLASTWDDQVDFDQVLDAIAAHRRATAATVSGRADR